MKTKNGEEKLNTARKQSKAGNIDKPDYLENGKDFRKKRSTLEQNYEKVSPSNVSRKPRKFLHKSKSQSLIKNSPHDSKNLNPLVNVMNNNINNTTYLKCNINIFGTTEAFYQREFQRKESKGENKKRQKNSKNILEPNRATQKNSQKSQKISPNLNQNSIAKQFSDSKEDSSREEEIQITENSETNKQAESLQSSSLNKQPTNKTVSPVLNSSLPLRISNKLEEYLKLNSYPVNSDRNPKDKIPLIVSPGIDYRNTPFKTRSNRKTSDCQFASSNERSQMKFSEMDCKIIIPLPPRPEQSVVQLEDLMSENSPERGMTTLETPSGISAGMSYITGIDDGL